MNPSLFLKKGFSMSDRRSSRILCVLTCTALALVLASHGTAQGRVAEKNAIYHNKTGWEQLGRGDRFRAISASRTRSSRIPATARP